MPWVIFLARKNKKQLDFEAQNIFTKPFQIVSHIRLAVQTWFISFSSRRFSSHFNFLLFFFSPLGLSRRESKCGRIVSRDETSQHLWPRRKRNCGGTHFRNCHSLRFEAPIQDFALYSVRNNKDWCLSAVRSARLWTSKAKIQLRSCLSWRWMKKCRRLGASFIWPAIYQLRKRLGFPWSPLRGSTLRVWCFFFFFCFSSQAAHILFITFIIHIYFSMVTLKGLLFVCLSCNLFDGLWHFDPGKKTSVVLIHHPMAKKTVLRI